MCFIVPAHIYNNLLEKGNEEQKLHASQILELLKSFTVARSDFLRNLIDGFTSEDAESVHVSHERVGKSVTRTIYDAEHKNRLPGKVVRREGEESNKDIAVDEAYDGSGKTYEFFHKVFNRDSIDDRGMELISTVHFGRNFANAFWNGSQMTYGDGDGYIFNRFTSVLDVIGHEISHGITERTAGLVYSYQSGALNEHFSDVFGSLIKQYWRNQKAEEADWLIGEGLFTDKIEGEALRSMKAPGTAYDDERIGKDPQPDHMDRYVKTDQDNGGVHINSSIPNKAFYHSAVNIGGYAWLKAGTIWYNTLLNELNSRSKFQDMVNATVKVAGKLYGVKSLEQKAVIDGWAEVGLRPSK